MGIESARTWAFEEFGRLKTSDRRWARRLVAMAAQAVRRPAGKVSVVYSDPAERQGAYGLLASPEVDAGAMVAAMTQAHARRCSHLPFVYVPIDGSSLTLTDTFKAKGFGAVGSRARGAQGLQVMTALLVSPAGVVMGMASQKFWARRGKPVKRQHKKLPAEQKQTKRWLDAMQTTAELMNENAPKTRCWFQLDREGDAWPTIIAADQSGHWFTIRSSHDRRVRVGNGEIQLLRSIVANLPSAGEYSIDIAGSQRRHARQATMSVRGCSVTLDFHNYSSQHFARTINAVLVREEGTTPSGEAPIEWLLLTNRPIVTKTDMQEVVTGYAQRWRIEEFHRAWKSGACNVEDNQLRSVSAVEKWATLLSAVAIRVERLKQLARTEPEGPASAEFTPVELRAIAVVRFGKQANKHMPAGFIPTLVQATTWIAEIGGYTGKSSGGPPGTTTITRGLSEVLTVARALEALEL